MRHIPAFQTFLQRFLSRQSPTFPFHWCVSPPTSREPRERKNFPRSARFPVGILLSFPGIPELPVPVPTLGATPVVTQRATGIKTAQGNKLKGDGYSGREKEVACKRQNCVFKAQMSAVVSLNVTERECCAF